MAKAVKKKPAKSKPVAAEKKEVFKASGSAAKVEIYGQKGQKEKAKYDVKIVTQKLGEAPKEYHFVLQDGKKLKSLQELAGALETMGEDVFRHHVNEFKNDFATWINDVFNEKKLSDEMRKINDKVESELKLLRHIVKKIAE